MNFPQRRKLCVPVKRALLTTTKTKKNKTKQNNTMAEKLYGAPLSFSELLRDDNEGATTG